MTTRVLVLGAAGDVGTGVVQQCLARQWSVVAVARTEVTLRALEARSPGGAGLDAIVGSIATDADGADLAANPLLAEVDAIVVSIGAGYPRKAIGDYEPGELSALFETSVVPHLVAIRHLLPLLHSGGTYVAVGGGTADVIMQDHVGMSVVHAGLRMLYKGVVKEGLPDGVRLFELILQSIISGHSNRESAQDSWLTVIEAGEGVCELIDNPAAFDLAIQYLPSPRI